MARFWLSGDQTFQLKTTTHIPKWKAGRPSAPALCKSIDCLFCPPSARVCWRERIWGTFWGSQQIFQPSRRGMEAPNRKTWQPCDGSGSIPLIHKPEVWLPPNNPPQKAGPKEWTPCKKRTLKVLVNRDNEGPPKQMRKGTHSTSRCRNVGFGLTPLPLR